MKKTILLSSIFALGAAFATGTDVESGNSIAALDVTVTKAAAQTLVAVPFLGYKENGAVAVQDMVKSSDLNGNKCKLFVPTAYGKYATWSLNSAGSWQFDEACVDVSPTGEPVAGYGTPDSSAVLARGDSFWIQLDLGEICPTSCKIYLLGQSDSPSAGSSTAVSGAWNLIGNASLNAKTITEGANNDQIVVQINGDLRYYTCLNGVWGYNSDSSGISPAKGNPTIAPGQGFWYRNADSSARTINW